MGKFFSRIRTPGGDPTNASWSNISGFYGLMIFLIAIPFVLIVALVWITGLIGFSPYILAGFLALLAVAVYRLYRHWGRFKEKLAAHSSQVSDLMREAAREGKNMEVSLLHGMFTLRYGSQPGWPAALPPSRLPPLALEGPESLIAQAPSAPTWLNPERLREELEEFHRLRNAGVISPEEFDRIKAGLLEKMAS